MRLSGMPSLLYLACAGGRGVWEGVAFTCACVCVSVSLRRPPKYFLSSSGVCMCVCVCVSVSMCVCVYVCAQHKTVSLKNASTAKLKIFHHQHLPQPHPSPPWCFHLCTTTTPAPLNLFKNPLQITATLQSKPHLQIDNKSTSPDARILRIFLSGIRETLEISPSNLSKLFNFKSQQPSCESPLDVRICLSPLPTMLLEDLVTVVLLSLGHSYSSTLCLRSCHRCSYGVAMRCCYVILLERSLCFSAVTSPQRLRFPRDGCLCVCILFC